jgi:anaerobic magnesium-protoporphyrin IX monomethyl ester cyclase
MAFKVMLIKPNILVQKGFTLHSRMSPPVGLAYIASSLLSAGYEAEIIDMVAEAPDKEWPYKDTHMGYGLTSDDLIERVKSSQPHLVGIGGFTSQFGLIRDIASSIKAYNPVIPIVLGGINATALPRYVLEHTRADYVIQGEGERAIVDLARMIETRKMEMAPDIDGLVYKDGESIIINPKKYFEQNLDTIAWPARGLFRHEQYIQDGVSMPVITSRGCPGRCAFCSVHILSGHKWRARDPYKVADEIEDLVSKWHYKTVSLFDDAANVKPERLIILCKEIVKRHLGIRLIFPSSLIIKYITRDLLYWMKQAGAVGLSLPIEHANEYMRNTVIRKRLDLAQVDRVLDWCRELKLITLANFVIGMPGETEETLQELQNYVRRTALRLDAISIYTATPFPGTAFYDKCIAEGLMKDPAKNDFLDFDTYTVHITTSVMTAEILEHHKKLIDKAFIEERGPDFPAALIRKTLRKPDEEGIAYLESAYFGKL